jgi:hypothetical protein
MEQEADQWVRSRLPTNDTAFAAQNGSSATGQSAL